MPTLYVTEPGGTVRWRGHSIVVTPADDDTALIEVEPHRLTGLVLVGRVHITRHALHHCLRHDVPVSWMTVQGRLRGRAVGPMGRSAAIRIAQLRRYDDPRVRLETARTLVLAKIDGGRALLRAYRRNYGGDEPLAAAMARLTAARRRVELADSLEVLRGTEGAAARLQFAAYGRLFRGQIGFASRRRRPPPDPANAMLSFGYVLLGSRIAAAIEARGLDPYVGYYHDLRPGRPALALDLLEPLRHAVVDRFVIRACNLGQLGPSDFEADGDRGGIRLTREGRRRFFAAWERYLQRPQAGLGGTARWCPAEAVRYLVDRLAAAIASDTPVVLPLDFAEAGR